MGLFHPRKKSGIIIMWVRNAGDKVLKNISDFVSHFSFSADYISESITQALGVRI